MILWGDKQMFKILTIFLKFVINKILFRTSYENLEILNEYSKCMICSNHSRIFDPIFILPKVENMYSVAKSELFENKLFGSFLAYNGAIPIKRNSTDRTGINSIINLFNEKENVRVLIFPEGGIYKENYLENKRNCKNGAVFIAATANVPIIPVHITVRPKYFSKVTVTFGEPFIVDQSVLKDRAKLREESKRLINYIYDLG